MPLTVIHEIYPLARVAVYCLVTALCSRAGTPVVHLSICCCGAPGCVCFGISYKTSGCGHLGLTFWLASLGNLPGGRSAGSRGRGHPASVATEPVSTPPAAGERPGSVQLHLLPSLFLDVGGLRPAVHYRFVVLIHISTFSQVHWGLTACQAHLFMSLLPLGVLCWTYLLQTPSTIYGVSSYSLDGLLVNRY